MPPARTLAPIMSSVTSTVKCSGNLVRQALDLDLARDDLEQSALQLDPGGLAGGIHRNRHANALRQVDPLQVGVQHVALDRIALGIDHHDGSILAALDRQIENVLWPVLLFRMWTKFLGTDPDRDRIL